MQGARARHAPAMTRGIWGCTARHEICTWLRGASEAGTTTSPPSLTTALCGWPWPPRAALPRRCVAPDADVVPRCEGVAAVTARAPEGRGGVANFGRTLADSPRCFANPAKIVRTSARPKYGQFGADPGKHWPNFVNSGQNSRFGPKSGQTGLAPGRSYPSSAQFTLAWDHKNQLRRVAPCKWHRFSSDSMPRVVLSPYEKAERGTDSDENRGLWPHGGHLDTRRCVAQSAFQGNVVRPPRVAQIRSKRGQVRPMSARMQPNPGQV